MSTFAVDPRITLDKVTRILLKQIDVLTSLREAPFVLEKMVACACFLECVLRKRPYAKISPRLVTSSSGFNGSEILLWRARLIVSKDSLRLGGRYSLTDTYMSCFEILCCSHCSVSQT